MQLSEQPLRHLAEESGETVNLGVLVGDQVLYLARLRNSDLVTANIQVGSTFPAAYTSMGKLLLAYLSDAELAATLATHDFAADAGPNAAKSLGELRERLAVIREQGYSLQDQEVAAGLGPSRFRSSGATHQAGCGDQHRGRHAATRRGVAARPAARSACARRPTTSPCGCARPEPLHGRTSRPK